MKKPRTSGKHPNASGKKSSSLHRTDGQRSAYNRNPYQSPKVEVILDFSQNLILSKHEAGMVGMALVLSIHLCKLCMRQIPNDFDHKLFNCINDFQTLLHTYFPGWEDLKYDN